MFARARMAIAAAALALAACGGDGPRHAGLESIGLGAEEQETLRGGSLGSRRGGLDEGSIGEYQAALERLAQQNEDRIAAAAEDDPRWGEMALRKQRLERQLKELDRAYSDHRERAHAAQGRVEAFLIRFGPELQWEADYGISSGDVGLVSALIGDVVERIRKQPTDPNAGPASARDTTSAEKLAADAFLHLGMLAEDMVDFETAERTYALARSYDPDLGVAVNTMDSQIALFRALGRDEEGKRIESERAAMLTR